MAISPLNGDKRKETRGAADDKVWWQMQGRMLREDVEWLLGGGARERTLSKLQTDGDLRKRRKMGPPR